VASSYPPDFSRYGAPALASHPCRPCLSATGEPDLRREERTPFDLRSRALGAAIKTFHARHKRFPVSNKKPRLINSPPPPGLTSNFPAKPGTCPPRDRNSVYDAPFIHPRARARVLESGDGINSERHLARSFAFLRASMANTRRYLVLTEIRISRLRRRILSTNE